MAHTSHIQSPSFATYIADGAKVQSCGEGWKREGDVLNTSAMRARVMRSGSNTSATTSDSDSETCSERRKDHENYIGNDDSHSSNWGSYDSSGSAFPQNEEEEDIEEACRMLASAMRARRNVHNLCAGPAGLPKKVLTQMCHDLLNFEGMGIGVEEMSHRDPDGPVQRCLADTCALLKELLDVPSNYEVLLMQGGAHGQFAAVALNLLGEKRKADYIDGGFWSQRACTEAGKFCEAKLVPGVRRNAETGDLEAIPPAEWQLSADAAFVHICANETITGMEFVEDPALTDTAARPLVADFTSTLLSRPVDVAKYGVIYASGGKNVGPAGVCLVIVRKDLLGARELGCCPSVLSYATAASTKPIPNVYNTPNMLSVRAVHLMLEDVRAKGGLKRCEEICVARAAQLYHLIDSSHGFYACRVAPAARSRTTIPFNIRGGDPHLEALFRTQAEQVGLYQIFGHHSVGGLRVCLYNSVSDASIHVLLRFLLSFQREHGSAQ